MDKNYIENRMHEFEKILGYKFKNIDYLCRAMRAERVRGERRKYTNDAMATLGDAVLKTVLAKHLIIKIPNITAEALTLKKSKIEDNQTLCDLRNKEGWINYAYNDRYFYPGKGHDRVRSETHDPYVEAVVGAVFLDGGYEAVEKWISATLVHLLVKYKDK